MKKAWIENGIIRDVAQGDPDSTYHPDVAARYNVDVPDDAKNGDAWDGETLTPPVAPESIEVPPAAVVHPKVTPPQFFMLFPVSVETSIRDLADTVPDIATWLRRLDDPRLTEVDLSLPSVQEGIAMVLEAVQAPTDLLASILTGELK